MRKYYTSIEKRDGYNVEHLTMFRTKYEEPAPEEEREVELKTFLGVVNAALAIKTMDDLVEQRRLIWPGR